MLRLKDEKLAQELANMSSEFTSQIAAVHQVRVYSRIAQSSSTHMAGLAPMHAQNLRLGCTMAGRWLHPPVIVLLLPGLIRLACCTFALPRSRELLPRSRWPKPRWN
jgi:hypothetical protein